MQNGTTLAAIDLGSNSFRLELGCLDHGAIRRSHYQKETVRLGNGLDAQGCLTPAAMQRGWDCLARFAERLQGMHSAQVRAVATQTLREARNRDDFLQRAQHLLGFPIDVISGYEEARLVYQGVVHLLPQAERSAHDRRLVIDIGGRSTELIVGHGFEPQVLQSYPLGCVAWSMRYFAQGQLNAQAFKAAQVAAQAVLEEAVDTYRSAAWTVAYGSSGTVAAVADVLRCAGDSTGLITYQGLQDLRTNLMEAKHVDRLKIEGLKSDRLAVIGGGVSVLCAIFELFEIEQMHVAQGALRHGLLYDVLDREHDGTDVRPRTVAWLSQKFNVDVAQAERVSQTAQQLLAQLGSTYVQHQRELHWAAQLHEIGCHLTHNSYHKHGAYILEHADAPGFSWVELHRLGLLVLGQRGKLRKLQEQLDQTQIPVLLCLRLSIILCHARRTPQLQGLQLGMSTKERRVTLSVASTWTQQFPQSMYLLYEEAQAWRDMPWTLVLSTD